jgi:hypothetical protein
MNGPFVIFDLDEKKSRGEGEKKGGKDGGARVWVQVE